jgi:hypothetical protein
MLLDQPYDSILINYPLPKILCNRAVHLLANLFLLLRVALRRSRHVPGAKGSDD